MSARESAELIGVGGVIRECKEEKTMLEKLNVFFTLIPLRSSERFLQCLFSLQKMYWRSYLKLKCQ